MNTSIICPRCTHFIPNDISPGSYIGAISRVDNSTEICSSCGTDEALEQLFTGGLTPKQQWPIGVSQ